MIHRITFLLLAVIVMVGNTASASQTSGTITAGGDEGYAWSSTGGWVNFGATHGTITITDNGITGYAWSMNYGWINMNPANGGVRVGANGALSGMAWGERLGWIDFAGVSIDGNGRFSGQATGVGIGTLSFGCDHCSVVTDYRPSSFRSVTSGGGGSGGSSTGTTLPVSAAGTTTQVVPLVSGIGSTEDGAADQSGFADTPVIVRELNALPERAAGSDVGSAPTDARPAQLFDIRLLIDDPSIERIVDLVARVTFESFGREPTPVEISYAVADATGQVLWRGSETVTVETELIVVKRFATIVDMPSLHEGSYMLHVHTRYNDTVEDDFSAPFTVEPQQAGGLIGWAFAGLASLLAALMSIRFIIARRREAQSALGLEARVS